MGGQAPVACAISRRRTRRLAWRTCQARSHVQRGHRTNDHLDAAGAPFYVLADVGRPHRIEPVGGTLHVTARGVRRDPIYVDDADRRMCNPVAAGLCADPAGWPWGSFRATAGLEPCPRFLAAARVRRQFGRGPRGAELYAAFVRARVSLVTPA